MPRALCLVLVLLVLLPSAASAEASAEPGANAGLKYWQAFAQLPRITEAEQQKLNAEYLTMPLDANAREIATKGEYALRMLQRGAALKRCDWGVSYEEDGIEVLLPHVQAARTLSSLAGLRARMRFEEGRRADALDDVLAAMALGRHVSRDGSLIAVLVGYSIENRMGDVLALYLPKLDPATIEGLKKRLAALPAFATPSSALLQCEKATLDWFIRIVKAAKDKEGLLAMLGPLNGESKDAPEQRREKGIAFLKACGGSADGIVQFAEKTRPSYTLMAKNLDLPIGQFADEFERERKRQAGNPVFQLFFPALDKMRWSQARMEVRRALLEAALAVQLEGRDALKTHTDPVASSPFEYTAFQGGFELRSPLLVDDALRTKLKLDERAAKPAVLTVGRKEK